MFSPSFKFYLIFSNFLMNILNLKPFGNLSGKSHEMLFILVFHTSSVLLAANIILAAYTKTVYGLKNLGTKI